MTKVSQVLAFMQGIILQYNCGGTGEQKQTGEKATPAAQTDPNDPRNNKGIGPIKLMVLNDINPALAAEGEVIYKEKCVACHKPTEKFVGPAPKGILDRRSPEWIMNMILNPEEMVKSDPIAKQLLIEANLAPMANQHLTEAQARKVLEYFRTIK